MDEEIKQPEKEEKKTAWKPIKDRIREKRERGEAVKPLGGKREGAGRKKKVVVNLLDLDDYLKEFEQKGGAVELFNEMKKKNPKEALLFLRDWKKGNQGKEGGTDKPKKNGDTSDDPEIKKLLELLNKPETKIDDWEGEVIPEEDQDPETEEEAQEYQEDNGEPHLDVEQSSN